MTRRHTKQDVWGALEDTDRRVEAIERLLAGPEPVVNLTSNLDNLWVNYDASGPLQRFPYYYRDRGRIYMGGVIQGGTVGAVAINLPIEARPSISLIQVVASNFALGIVVIDPSGSFYVWSGSNVFIDLSSISYRLAT